jgi:hypothetical protein
MHEAMGARPWVARTQMSCAAGLLERGDETGALELLAEACAAADALGMTAVAMECRERGGEPVRPGT